VDTDALGGAGKFDRPAPPTTSPVNPTAPDSGMIRQLLLGGVISLVNIAIHATAMTIVVSTARRALEWRKRYSQLWLAATMVATVGVLLATHLVEVLVWSLTYDLLDVTPPGTDILYFALVNYTTLGYGDIVPVQWRLLGPMTAMNGILLFGWSTAVIFEVLREALRVSGQGER
jgi:hypothetical protein